MARQNTIRQDAHLLTVDEFQKKHGLSRAETLGVLKLYGVKDPSKKSRSEGQIKRHGIALPPKEEFIQDVLKYNLKHLTKKYNTSGSTITNYARELGYDGMRGLRKKHGAPQAIYKKRAEYYSTPPKPQEEVEVRKVEIRNLNSDIGRKLHASIMLTIPEISRAFEILLDEAKSLKETAISFSMELL